MGCGNSECLYTDIWRRLLPIIVETVECGCDVKIDLNGEVFEAVGSRKTYSFKNVYKNGRAVEISNSAVARDLADVLDGSPKFKSAAKDKNIAIRMGKNFNFSISFLS